MKIKTLIKESLPYKLLKSLKHNGIKATLIKIKYKLLNTQMRVSTSTVDIDEKAVNKKIIDNMQTVIEEVERSFCSVAKVDSLVSIIIPTRDGLENIKRLFKAIDENTLYKNYEIIVVNNASKDQTKKYLESNEYNFDLKVINNDKNESFSYANNQAAKIAKGEFLLLLNDDTQPLKGWLSHLVESFSKDKHIGAVGSQLIYPYVKHDIFSTKVQHAGIAFNYEKDENSNEFFRPYNIGVGKTPIVYNKKLSIGQRVALTAACVLVKKDIFLEIGGLDESYNYGYEDVDFGLKLHKHGYKSYYCQNSILFHYESATQKKDLNEEIVKRREKNLSIFKSKWHQYIKENFFKEKFKNTQKLFSEKKLKIAFAVTEAGDDVSAGDYFTALELAEAFVEMGYEYSFLRRRGGNWYNVPNDVDVIVSMLDAYDLNELKNKTKNIITIAWIRNWPDRWLRNRSFHDYNLIFASSQKLCELISKESGRKTTLFPIATTPKKFKKEAYKDKEFLSDYTFTGNYWGVPREIETFLNPKELNFKFNIYGRDWNMVPKFAPYHKGFLQYKNIPKVYANTKVVIDDAVVGITKPYGSVNSRVFDAIAGGALVVTNGTIGAKETFGELLPTYETKEDLHSFLEEYLNDDKKREEKIKKLQEFVFNNHTYRIRAQLMKKKLEEFVGIKKSIVIKMPIPKWDEAKNWGDYHLALGLKKQFEKLGYFCLLQVLPEWDNKVGDACDIVIVIRGLSQYKTKKHQYNIMWNISHPDKITIDEYNSYDLVLVASNIWADKIKNEVDTKVKVFHQCTDVDLFLPYKDEQFKHQVLFVGNSRNIFRKSLKYLLPTKYDLSVYGTLWDGIIDKKYIKGEYIDNKELYKYYSNADIVLNDHWDSMRENGFISNRLFDVLACNGFILSDDVGGIKELFGDDIITYKTKDDLEDKVEYYLKNKDECKKISNRGRDKVLKNHTFKNRVFELLSYLDEKM